MSNAHVDGSSSFVFGTQRLTTTPLSYVEEYQNIFLIQDNYLLLRSAHLLNLERACSSLKPACNKNRTPELVCSYIWTIFLFRPIWSQAGLFKTQSHPSTKIPSSPTF